MSRYEHGRILAVNEVRLGSELVADHAAGVTSLTVEDPVDFDEDGGWLQVGDEVIEYSTFDDDTGEITLKTALATAALEGDRVFLWDELRQVVTTDKIAQVELDGDDDNTDPLEATIPLHLLDDLAEGIRGVRGESVLLEQDGDEWRIVDVLGVPGSASAGGGGMPWEDSHTVVALGAQEIELTYEPITPSEKVFLGGLYRPSSEWTRTDRIITVPDPNGLLRLGDEFWVEYLYHPGQAAMDAQPPVRWWAGIEDTCPTEVWGRPTGFDLSTSMSLVDDGTTYKWNHMVNWSATWDTNPAATPPAAVSIIPVWYWTEVPGDLQQEPPNEIYFARGSMGGFAIGSPLLQVAGNVRFARDADGSAPDPGVSTWQGGASSDEGNPLVRSETVDALGALNHPLLRPLGVQIFPGTTLDSSRIGYTDICAGRYWCGAQIRPSDDPVLGVAAPYL